MVFLIRPTVLDIQIKSEEMIAQKKSFLSSEIRMKNLQSFKKSLLDINVASEKANNLLINEKAPVEFVRFLEKSAIRTNIVMSISAAQPSKSTKKNTWSSISFQIETFSTFPNFLKFLERIEFSPYLIEINNLNVRHIAEGELSAEEIETFSVKDVKGQFTMRVFTK
ncbi:MAG: hypothetical protein ABH967_00200 [Patescibacteria group bacterium]